MFDAELANINCWPCLWGRSHGWRRTVLKLFQAALAARTERGHDSHCSQSCPRYSEMLLNKYEPESATCHKSLL
jgi:hypothetical protein